MTESVTKPRRRLGAAWLVGISFGMTIAANSGIYAWGQLSPDTQAIVTQVAWLIFTN